MKEDYDLRLCFNVSVRNNITGEVHPKYKYMLGDDGESFILVRDYYAEKYMDKVRNFIGE